MLLPMRVIVTIFVVTLASPTFAQETDTNTNESIARTHFEAGNAYYERGNFEAAIREFQHAYDLSQRPALLHNIYLAYRDLQDDTNAAVFLRRYLNEAEDVDNRALLERRLRELESSNSASEERSPAGWVVLTSGVAAILGGAIAGGLAIQSRNTLDDEWCNDRVCREGFATEQDRGQRAALSSTILLSVGAVAIAASIPIFVLSGRNNTTARLNCGPSGCFGTVRAAF